MEIYFTYDGEYLYSNGNSYRPMKAFLEASWNEQGGRVAEYNVKLI